MIANILFGQKHAAILQALCHLTSEQHIAILKKADPKLIRCICKCALNILRGNVPLKQPYKQRLKRYTATLRQLANKNNS